MPGAHGGSLCRTPDAALFHVDTKDPGMPSSRHPLLAVRTPASKFKRKLEWPVETPSKPPCLSRFRRPPPRGGESPWRVCITPYRVHCAKTAHGGSVQRKLTKSASKPACALRTSGAARGLGLGSGYSVAAKGLQATVVNSEEVPHYELQEDPSFWMKNNVQVVIRVRPLNNTERNLHGYNRCLKQESGQSITWTGHPENRFTFDHVACESVNQEELFRVIGLPMVHNCMAGYSGCVFAYGQTGSGKTHTMLGEISELGVTHDPERGMIPRMFELLIARIRAEEESRRDEKLQYNCKCSFLEIYNEQITDLLDPSSTNLPLREDTVVGAYVENLTKREVTCVGDIITLLMQGSVNRKVCATNMNSASSRSHAVFTCTIESRWEKDSISNSRFVRLNLVDLAGSERQTASGAEGERLKEASNINKSLSTLSHVIMSLVDRTCGKRHVPYRDSKLTFLLQDSLGGNSKTLIIANVSPSSCSSNETLSTLKFAQRAKLIENNAIVNEDSIGDVQALKHQICVLKEELAVIKGERALQTNGALEAEEHYANAVCHLSKEQEATELSSRLDSFGKKIPRLQAQEAMLVRADSMYNELSVLTEEIDVTNRSSVAAESKEKEQLRHQLDEALLLNGMLKETILEVLSLPEVNSAIPANDMKECNEFELCRLLVNYHHESAMINTIANDIGSTVLASQMEQYRVQLQNQTLMFTEVLERLNAESTLWKVDQELGSVAIHALHDENSNIRIDLKNLRQSKDEVMESLLSELARKDELANGLSFDLSLLQESASVAKEQADQFIELTEAIKSLEHEVASKSHDLANLVSGRQVLETQISKSDEKIYVLEEQLANTVSKLNAVCIENSELRSQLNHIEQIRYSMKEELAGKSNATERMEERLIELRNLLDERSSFLQNLQNDFSKLSDEKQCCDSQVLVLRDKLDRAQAVAEESEASATEAQQMADEMKAYVEEKDEEVKLFERSIGDLESTVCAPKDEQGTEPSGTVAKDTEITVLSSELERHKAELQEQMLICTEVLEGLKTEATLWKVDQELGSIVVNDLLEENSNIRTDLENLKRNKDEVMEKLKSWLEEVRLQQSAVPLLSPLGSGNSWRNCNALSLELPSCFSKPGFDLLILHVPWRRHFDNIFTNGLSSPLFLDFRSILNVRRSPVVTKGEC